MIPQQYILRRWTKNLIPAALRNKRNKYGEKNVVVENCANEETLIVDYCIHLLSKDEPRLGAFIEKLKSLKKDVEADCPNPTSKKKTNNLEQLVGVLKPPVVEVNNPTVGSTKGRKKLCIKGGKEKAIETSLKCRNSCSLCGGTDHNKRTCPDACLSFHIIFAMSTQQDIYAANSESRPHMLNKENYVPWSYRLLRYAKSRPNGKLIHNSIINGPYVRRMIPEPGDTNREVPVNETFHVQTDDELTKKELKQIEADDQSIQTILLGLLEDIYAAVDSCETAQEIWLRVQQMMKGSDIGIQEKKAKLFNEWERQIAQPGMNIGQDKQMQMVGGNGENQFRQYAGQNVGNLNGYNAVQNVRNQHVLREMQLGIMKEDAGIQLQAKEFDLMAAAADLDEIKKVNANCILMANLQQASTSGTQTDKAPVYDSDGSAEVHDYENCDDNEIFNMFTQEEQYTELLEPIPEQHQVPQNDNDVISEVTSVEQGGETVEQHPTNFEETPRTEGNAAGHN
nr:protein FAR1-related sequence 5 [Tanacetum cinerariifolium]